MIFCCMALRPLIRRERGPRDGCCTCRPPSGENFIAAVPRGRERVADGGVRVWWSTVGCRAGLSFARLMHHEGAPLSTEQLEFASLRSWGGTVAELADWIFDPAASLADVRALRDAC